MKNLSFAEGLTLPVDAVTETFGFIAKKGGGKSYAVDVMLEQFYEIGAQFGVMDPIGRHFGLRLAANGKGKGLDVAILGGLRGDIPLDPDSGKLVADAFCDHGRSMIFDVSQFSLSARKRFATAFGNQLWLRQKMLMTPRPMHIVLEEAQLIVPQFAGRDDAHMVGIWSEIVRLGRNVGIGVSLVTQRPQSVSKEVLTQVECLVVFQVNGVPEKKALKLWMVEKGDSKMDLLEELPFLKVGEAYVWSPSFLQHYGKHQINKKWTFDASATPKVGVKRVETNLPPLDLGALEAQMAATKQKIDDNDPVALKKQIQTLRAALAKGQVCAVPERKVTEVIKEVPAITDAQVKRFEKMIEAAIENCNKFDALTTKLLNVLPKPVQGLTVRLPNGHGGALTAKVTEPRSTFEHGVISRSQGTRVDARTLTAKGEQKISGGARRMLIALAKRPSLTRTQIGVLSDLSTNSGSFATYMAQLNVAGFISKQGDEVSITDAGRAALGPDANGAPMTTQELVNLWKGKFPAKVGHLLQELVEIHPQGKTREQAGEYMGMSTNSGSFATYLSMLRANRLIVNTEQGLIKASADLFL